MTDRSNKHASVLPGTSSVRDSDPQIRLQHHPAMLVLGAGVAFIISVILVYMIAACVGRRCQRYGSRPKRPGRRSRGAKLDDADEVVDVDDAGASELSRNSQNGTSTCTRGAKLKVAVEKQVKHKVKNADESNVELVRQATGESASGTATG